MTTPKPSDAERIRAVADRVDPNTTKPIQPHLRTFREITAELRSIADAIDAEQAQAELPKPDIPLGCEMTRNWAVTVEAEGQRVLTLSSNGYSGLADLEPWKSTIRGCAEHLWAFIGAEQPQGEQPAKHDGEFGQGIEPNPKARYWQERAEFWRGQAVALGWRERRNAENGEQPAQGAPDLPESFARVCDDGYWLLRIASTQRFDVYEGRNAAQDVYSADQMRAMYQRGRDAASPAPAALPNGWKLVPVEPTEEMIDAVADYFGWCDEDKQHPDERSEVRQTYAEMVAAAPTPPAAVPERELRAEIDRLNAIINTPHADDFLRAVSIEAEHQRQRWGSEQDSGKTAADWFWLVGHLAGKALHAHAAGDVGKAEHHVITAAAALANWHRALFGRTDMRPGIDSEAALAAEPAQAGAPAADGDGHAR